MIFTSNFEENDFCRYNLCSALLAFALMFSLVIPAFGQVVIPPDRRPRPVEPSSPIHIKNIDVETEIVNRVAVTSVRKVIQNRTNRQIEGEYIFPLPKSARVTDFSMSVNGEQISGEVLDEAEARRIYEQIVRRRNDPGLLRYVGQGALRVNVFPIGPKQERTVKIQYQQTLRDDNGRVGYQLPLTIGQQLHGSPDAVTVEVSIQDRAELKSIRSPSHSIDVSRNDLNHATVHYSSETEVSSRDFKLFYTIGKGRFGIDLMIYRENGSGYFSLSLTPSYDQDRNVLPKDIAFVIDVSGSMQRYQKIEQAKESLEHIVSSLGPEDRFNLISFSSVVEPFRDKLQEVSVESKKQARSYIKKLSATGSTNLHGAITEGLKMDPGDPDRPFMVVLLTDGKPTSGQTTDSDEIVAEAKKLNQNNARVFTVGVGYDVNSVLLDKLTAEHNGDRMYVTPGESLEARLSTFYGKISNPVLSNLSLTIDGVRARDLYPVQLSDLFKGSQLMVHGRYEGTGSAEVVFTGQRGGETVTISRTVTFPAQETNYDFLPRSWARVKIGYLVDQIRQHGMNPELKQELVRLSKEFGIVTEYTASLILEDEEMARAPQFREMHRAYRNREQQLSAAGDRAMKSSSGRGSIEASKQARRFQRAEAIPEQQKEAVSRKHVKQVGSKTFYLSDGTWYDREYDEDKQTQTIQYLSDRYFRLLDDYPELARYFSIGKEVIVGHEGTFYHVVIE